MLLLSLKFHTFIFNAVYVTVLKLNLLVTFWCVKMVLNKNKLFFSVQPFLKCYGRSSITACLLRYSLYDLYSLCTFGHA